jgi:fructokinase
LKNIDIICIGEVLIDFIGHETNATISNTENYHRFLGGSPTNVAVNAARIGLQSALVATCGQDGLGDFIIDKLSNSKVNTQQIRQSESNPTSVIFVSKSTETPDFIAYREADCEILESQLSDEIIASAKIFHTTCFALSKNPARTTILNRAKKAAELGLRLSIDINFSERIWSNREESIQVITEYLSHNPLVKVSEDDCFRLFETNKSDIEIFDFFHSLGAETVCLTKGKNGVVLSDIKEGLFYQNALQITNIKDSTGAGDAFWTGFLDSYLKNKSFEESIAFAQKLASIKLQNVGELPEKIEL